MKTDCRMAPLAVIDSAFKRRPTGLFRQHDVRLSAAQAVLAVLAVAACLAARPAAAQVPPSAAEVAAYGSLHSAAQRGDVAAVVRLAALPTAREVQPMPASSIVCAINQYLTTFEQLNIRESVEGSKSA